MASGICGYDRCSAAVTVVADAVVTAVAFGVPRRDIGRSAVVATVVTITADAAVAAVLVTADAAILTNAAVA